MADGDSPGPPEPDGSGGEPTDGRTGARMAPAGDFGKLANAVADLEAMARSLKAVQQRARFRIVE